MAATPRVPGGRSRLPPPMPQRRLPPALLPALLPLLLPLPLPASAAPAIAATSATTAEAMPAPAAPRPFEWTAGRPRPGSDHPAWRAEQAQRDAQAASQRAGCGCAAPAEAARGKPFPGRLLPSPAAWQKPTHDPAEAADAADRHRRTLPERQREIEAALAQGADPDQADGDDDLPPLHRAIAYGSPQIVDLLLRHGADPNRRDDRKQRTPLEYLLDTNEQLAPWRQPLLLTPAERGAIVERLVQAGARRPYQAADAALAESGVHRPAADYLAWNALVALTEGEAPLRALLRTGTRPALDPDDEATPSPLTVAAAAGNAGALALLAELLPKTLDASERRPQAIDLQLDAALAALAGGHDAIARRLLQPGLPWQQTGPHVGEDRALAKATGERGPGTALHHAVRRGDAALVTQLLAWGAPVDGAPQDLPNTPLAEAVELERPAIALLLAEAGADSLSPTPGGRSALARALLGGNFDLARGLLQHLGRQRGDRFAQEAGGLLVTLVEATAAGTWTSAQEAELLALFESSGMDPRRLPGTALSELISHRRHDLALSLLQRGAPATLPDDGIHMGPPLHAALRSQAPLPLVSELLRRGAGHSRPDGEGRLPMHVALAFGRSDAAELLLQAGATLALASAEHGTALDAAIASGRPDTVDHVLRRTGRPLGEACITAAAAVKSLAVEPGFGAALAERGLRLDAGCGAEPPLLHRITQRWLAQPDQTPDTGWWQAAGAATAINRPMAATGLPPLHSALRAGRADLVSALLQAGAGIGWTGDAAAAPAWLAIASRDPALLRRLAESDPRIWQQRVPGGLTAAQHVQCREPARFAAALSAPAAAACPAAARADAASMRRVAGAYRLQAAREMAAGLQLHPDGRFDFGITYGGVDQQARGRWWLHRNQVLLLTEPPAPPDWVVGSQSTEAAAQARPDDPPIALHVTVTSPEDGLVWSNMALTAEFSNGRSRSGKTGRGGTLAFVDRRDEDWAGARVRRLGVAHEAAGLPIRWFDVAPGTRSLTLHFSPGGLVAPAFSTVLLDADPRRGTLVERSIGADDGRLRFSR